MIAFRRLIPQSSVDDADNAGVCEIADQSPDTLLELDNHFGNADIHQSVLSNRTLILDNWIGNRKRKPENDNIGKNISDEHGKCHARCQKPVKQLGER